MWIAGVCVTQSRTSRLDMSDLMEPTQKHRPAADEGGADDSASEEMHIIMGDFNTSTWRGLYEEWRREAELWQLNDPRCPTRNGGGVLDHALLAPGE